MTLILSRSRLHRAIIAPETPPSLTPILDLAFKETSGTAAADEQSLQAGVYVGGPDLGVPAMVTGGGGFGYKDADIQYATIAHNAAFLFPTAFTIGVAFMPSVLGGSESQRRGIVSKRSAAGHEVSLEQRVTNGVPVIRAYKSAAAGGAVFVGPSTGFSQLQVGRTDWIWIVSTAEGTRVVHRGQEFTQSTPLLDGALTSNSGSWGLGCYLDGSTPLIPGNGCIGRFRLYDFALTNTQIADEEVALPVHNTIWLRQPLAAVFDEGSGSLDLTSFCHPESGTAEVVADGSDVDLTASGLGFTYTTSDISETTEDTGQVRFSFGGLTSNTQDWDFTVQPSIPGIAPLRPSLSTFLASDEADPGTITKYVSNQNRGNGSGSSAANAQEVQSALNGASAGQTFLAICQTPGTIEFWDYPSGLTFPAGSSGNYITLQARNGDGVVISRGEDFAGARTTGSGFWTQSGLSQADIDKDIWKSVATFSGGDEHMDGVWIEFDHPHRLYRYQNMTNLRAAYGTEATYTNYGTVGVHKDSTGTVYIRMQKPHPVKYSRADKWSSSLWPGHTEAISGGQLAYPVSSDPNDYVIYLTRPATLTHAFTMPSWNKLGPGINSLGHRFGIRNNCHDLWVDRGLHLHAWNAFIRGSSTGSDVRRVFLNRVRCTPGSRRHMSISEAKFGGPIAAWRDFCFNMSDDDTLQDIHWLNSTIGDYHEILPTTRT